MSHPSAASPKYTVTVLGCGKMAGALLRSWLSHRMIERADIYNRSPIDKALLSHSNITEHGLYNGQAINTNILIIGLKPQMIKEVCSELSSHISEDTSVISIAAGFGLATLNSIFAQNQPIIRVMPNTPSAVNQGVSALVANPHVTPEQKQQAQSLFQACGVAQWLDDEALMDAVTALSGSGPAYVFYLIEMLEKAGKSVGLPADIAKTFARQTVIGSAELAARDHDVDAQTLRQNVTSPNGTTQAALDILMDGRAQEVFEQALKAAKARSKELGQ